MLYHYHGSYDKEHITHNDALWILQDAKRQWHNHLKNVQSDVPKQRYLCRVEHEGMIYSVNYCLATNDQEVLHHIHAYRRIANYKPEEIKTREKLLEEHKDIIPMFL